MSVVYIMNCAKTYNGRIDRNNTMQGPDISSLFKMYDKIPANQCVTYRDPTLGQWSDSALSLTYFSKENIQIIQNGIRSGVFQKSNSQYTIGNQDCDSLKVVMRSVFLQHAVNLPDNISTQVDTLNQIVLKYCIYSVYSEAQGYMKYLHDVSTLAVPMPSPILVKQYDRRDSKLPKWF